MIKFTPGPWSKRGNAIDGPNRVQVSFAYGHRKSAEEQDANAALIAASPDLYEAVCPIS